MNTTERELLERCKKALSHAIWHTPLMEDIEAYLAKPIEAPCNFDGLAKLGWQAVECSICGSHAMAYPKPVQEPVAWLVTSERQDGVKHTYAMKGKYKDVRDSCDFGEPIPLYTSPQPREPMTEALLKGLDVPNPDWWMGQSPEALFTLAKAVSDQAKQVTDIAKPAQVTINQYEQAIDDELVNSFLGTKDDFKDAKSALLAIIDWTRQVALDPAISPEAAKLLEQAKPVQEKISDDEILNAIARGWCHAKNEHKTMDIDLVSAIASEVYHAIKAHHGIK